MKKVILLTAGMLLATQAFASDVDLKQIMKEMKLEFKHAAEAQTVDEMQAPVQNLTKLVNTAKTGDFPPERKDLFLEGFNKLTLALDSVENDLEQGNLAQAKDALREVDSLRKEYHEKKKPSIWEKLFG